MLLAYSLVLAVAPCLVRGSCYCGRRSAYSFDANLAHHPSWMAQLPDETNLTSLSIPGTHDTMTYGPALRDDDVLNCQNWNLSVQLAAGLRYFDIRARLHGNDELHIYHASGYTGFSLAHVLGQMVAFLDRHPSEALVVRLKQEGPPLGSNNSLSFEQAFVRCRDATPGAAARMPLYDRAAPLPALGALRSRILLLQNFPSRDDLSYGPEWNGPLMALEDAWIVPDIYHLADKWTAIRDALERAATDPLDNSRLYLAHVSGSVGVLPVDVAAGPLSRNVVGTNDMTGQWLRDFAANSDARRAGIVIFDFPGKLAIEAVLDWNRKLAAPS